MIHFEVEYIYIKKINSLLLLLHSLKKNKQNKTRLAYLCWCLSRSAFEPALDGPLSGASPGLPGFP